MNDSYSPSQRTSAPYRVAVVGSGMVGAAAALGLTKLGADVDLFDVNTISAALSLAHSEHLPSHPLQRVSALNSASLQLMEQLGVYQQLRSERVRPYTSLNVYSAPRSGQSQRLHFSNDMVPNCTELGCFAENERLRALLLNEYCQQLKHPARWFEHTTITALDVNSGELTFNDQNGTEQRNRYQLIIGCDGQRSLIRQLAHIPLRGFQYRQAVFTQTVECASVAHQQETWQRFRPQGPYAYLPLYDRYGSLVVYDEPHHIRQLVASSAQRESLMTELFSPYIGEFTPVEQASFPIRYHRVARVSTGKAVVIGDAAHSISPMAGQGVNMGFKDVSQILAWYGRRTGFSGVNYRSKPKMTDISQLGTVLDKQQASQHALLSGTINLVYGLSKSTLPLISNGFELGFSFIEQQPWLKRKILQQAMGV